MKSETLLGAILPDVLIDNFDVINFEKTDVRFDIWLDEKKFQLREDKRNSDIISLVSAPTIASMTSPSAGAPLPSMSASASGLTSPPARCSAMTGTCPSSTRRG